MKIVIDNYFHSECNVNTSIRSAFEKGFRIGVKKGLSAQPEPCEEAVSRASVEYICQKNTVSTNPYKHKYHDKFIQFMDDPEISDFGRWQHSNGFNTALVAVECDLDKVPSVMPKAERRWNPCDWCAYNPPSSMDGKPCTVCPAVANPEPYKEGDDE